MFRELELACDVCTRIFGGRDYKACRNIQTLFSVKSRGKSAWFSGFSSHVLEYHSYQLVFFFFLTKINWKQLKWFQQKVAGTACWCRRDFYEVEGPVHAPAAQSKQCRWTGAFRSCWDSGAPGYTKNMRSFPLNVLLCSSGTLFIFLPFVRNSTFVCQHECFLLLWTAFYFVYILVRKIIFSLEFDSGGTPQHLLLGSWTKNKLFAQL